MSATIHQYLKNKCSTFSDREKQIAISAWKAALKSAEALNPPHNKQLTPPCPSCGLPTSAQFYCMDEECSEYGKVGGIHL